MQATREDVERWWQDCLDGRRTRRETSAWAEDRLDEVHDSEELVLQGLLELQTFTFHGPSQAGLRRWQEELRTYDSDPDAWNRRWFQRVLTHFLETHTVDRTRAFGHRLVRAGHLTPDDVEAALTGE